MSGPKVDTAMALIGRLEQEKQFSMSAMLEISDRCNEVCVHCYQIQGQKGEMTTEQVYRVLDDLARAGVLILTLSGGEVTLRADFLDIVSYARKQGFLLRIFTNGLLIDEVMAKKLGDLAVETVEISLYSHVAETHDFVTGVPGSFVKTVRAVRALIENRVAVIVKTPLMSVNEHHIDDYRAFVEGLGARLRLSPGDMLPREGGTGEPWALNPSYEANLGLAKRHREERVQPRRPKTGARSRSCGAGRTIHVEANGELRPCSVLEVKLGNLTERGLEQTQASSTVLQDMLALTFEDLHGCRDCEISGYCGRCYAKALAEVGDALGPHPSACSTARSRYEAHHETPLVIEGGGKVGPYLMTGEHRCRVGKDEVSAADEALAQRLGWARGTPQPANGDRVRPGELVQLRRPGQKRDFQVRVPTGVDGQAE